MTIVRYRHWPLFAAVLALVLTTGACTKRPPSTWQKSNATQENWSHDEINCRSLARRKVNREYRAQASSGDFSTGTTFGQSMNRYDAKKRQQALVEACLRSRGYGKSQTPPKPPVK